MGAAKQQDAVFLTLDGIRGFGAIVVVVVHSILFWGMVSNAPVVPFVVDVFLILSGFVVAFAYEPKIAAGMSTAAFMRLRIVRLYPLYLLGIALAGAVLTLASLDDAGKLAAVAGATVPQLAMLPSPPINARGDLYPLNMPAWTLLFELLVNLIYVLFWKRLTTAVVILLVAFSVGFLVALSLIHGTLDMGSTWWMAWGGFARAMFGFFAGVLIYRLMGSPREAPKRRSWMALPALLVVPALTFLPEMPIPRILVELGIVFIAGPTLVVWGASLQPPPRFAAVLAWFGAVSYALYIVHYPIFQVVKRLSGRIPALYETYAPWTGLAILVIAIAVAAAAVEFYDRPMRRWMGALLRGKPQARPGASIAP